MLSAINEVGDGPSDDSLRAICSVAVYSMCIAMYGGWECIAAMSDDLVRMVHHDRFARILLLFRPRAAKASHAKRNCLIVPKVGNKAPEIDG